MKFAHLTDDADGAACRDRHWYYLSDWAEMSQADSERWYFFTPEFLFPATGDLHFPLFAQISRMLGLNATERITQFAVGPRLLAPLLDSSSFLRPN